MDGMDRMDGGAARRLVVWAAVLLVCGPAVAAPRYMPDGIEVGGSGSGYGGSGGGCDITSAGAINADGKIKTDDALEVDGTITAGSANTVITNEDGTLDGAAIESGGVDISAKTNLAVSSPIVLTDDTLSHAATAGYIHIPTGGAAGQALLYGGSSGTAAWGAVDVSTYTNLAVSGSIIVLTDDTLSHATTPGYIHIPTGGAAGQYLLYGGSSGTAAWTSTATLSGTTNQVTVTGGTGVLFGSGTTLSLPQDIGTGSSPTFAKLSTTEIEYTGNMTLDAINAAADSTVTIQNSAATYETNLGLDGDLGVGGDASFTKTAVAIGAPNGGTLTLGAEGAATGNINLHAVTGDDNEPSMRFYPNNAQDGAVNYWEWGVREGYFVLAYGGGSRGYGIEFEMYDSGGAKCWSDFTVGADLTVAGANIGPSGDADLLTMAANSLTVAGDVAMQDCVAADTADYCTFDVWSYGVDTYYPMLILGHARGTQASPTATQAADILGEIRFRGHDTAESTGAKITATADNEWGTGGDWTDNPTEIGFYTTPDGSGTQVLRMLIDSTGLITTPGSSITLDTGSVTTTAGRLITGTGSAGIGATIDASGNVSTDGTGAFGDASTDTYTFTGRMIVRTIANTSAAGSAGEIAFCSGDSKFYGCTAATPTWAALH